LPVVVVRLVTGLVVTLVMVVKVVVVVGLIDTTETGSVRVIRTV